MKLPVGTAVMSGKELSSEAFIAALDAQEKKAASGYSVLTAQGIGGMEEGIVLFRNGEIIGSAFSFLKYGSSFFAVDALRLTMNATRLQYGVFDVVALSKQQAELVIAFNDKMGLDAPVRAKDLSKQTPKKYESALVERFVGEKLKQEESRFEVLKKFGLKGVQ